MSVSNLQVRQCVFASDPMRSPRVYEWRWNFQHSDPKVKCADRVLYLHADFSPANMTMEKFIPNTLDAGGSLVVV